MDPEIANLTSDVPDIPTFIFWALTYIGNTLLLILSLGILSWILRKTTGWITSITTCHLAATSLICLLTSLFLIPNNLLAFNHLLPNKSSLEKPLEIIGLVTLALTILHFLTKDIPSKIKGPLKSPKKSHDKSKKK